MEEDSLPRTQESEKQLEDTLPRQVQYRKPKKKRRQYLYYLNRQEKHVTFAIVVHDSGN